MAEAIAVAALVAWVFVLTGPVRVWLNSRRGSRADPDEPAWRARYKRRYPPDE